MGGAATPIRYPQRKALHTMPSTPAERSTIAQIAALTRVSREPSGTAMTTKARDTFWDSFERGHECKFCPAVTIDQSLPGQERQRQVTALRRAHFSRMGRNARLAARVARDAAALCNDVANAV